MTTGVAGGGERIGGRGGVVNGEAAEGGRPESC